MITLKSLKCGCSIVAIPYGSPGGTDAKVEFKYCTMHNRLDQPKEDEYHESIWWEQRRHVYVAGHCCYYGPDHQVHK